MGMELNAQPVAGAGVSVNTNCSGTLVGYMLAINTGPAFLPSGELHQYLLLRCSADSVEGGVHFCERVAVPMRDIPPIMRTR
jgi:hypothetical protein